MHIKLNWVEDDAALNPLEASAGQKVESVVHYTKFKEVSESKIKAAVIDCIDKAVSLFPVNLEDDSRYFLFEWDVIHSTLTIVVTDDSKENDSQHVVRCFMSALDNKMNELAKSSEDIWQAETEEFAELVRGWIHNYLTTCSAFMKYSLIAVFHSETRETARIL